MKPNWFVGLPVAAQSWLDSVLATLPPECRGFQAEDVHMTLAFLGPMPADRQAAVAAVMDRIEFEPIAVTLGKLLTLPSKRRVSALSFSLTRGREEVCELIARWRDALIAAGAGRPETRPPLAHVTVARPLRKTRAQGQRAALHWAAQVSPPDMEILVDRIALYTWAQDRRTRQFQIVHQKNMRDRD